MKLRVREVVHTLAISCCMVAGFAYPAFGDFERGAYWFALGAFLCAQHCELLISRSHGGGDHE